MTIIFEPDQIPGMIEKVEQDLLFDISRTLSLTDEDCVVEFGSFLGRSSTCIAKGLVANSSRSSENLLFAYDSFRCHQNAGFAPHVKGFCTTYKIDHLLKYEGQYINFFPVFEYFTSFYLKSGVVTPVMKELMESRPPGKKISLMHIDSPKFYNDFKPILFTFFPDTKLGCKIIFQDFFYHWSATLIAAVGLMMEMGYLKATRSAASSLVCELVKKITLEDLVEIDINMTKSANVPKYIGDAIQITSKLEVDRRDIFAPRLKLAQIQWLYEQGQHESATVEIVNFFNNGGQINSALANDFIELMQFGFSIRKLYELDHT